jgi:hypothetical protein
MKFYGFWGDFLCRHAEISLIFTVFVIHENDHAASADFLYGFFGRDDIGALTYWNRGRHRKHCSSFLQPVKISGVIARGLAFCKVEQRKRLDPLPSDR